MNSSALNVSHFSKPLSRISKDGGPPRAALAFTGRFHALVERLRFGNKTLQEGTQLIFAQCLLCARNSNYFQPIKTRQGDDDDLSAAHDKTKDQRGSGTHPGSHSSDAEFKQIADTKAQAFSTGTFW